MSETKELTTENNKGELLEQLASDETLQITVRKGTNDVIIRNPKDNRIVRLKANIEERIEEQEDEEYPPLKVEEFERALRELNELGLTFSPELSPSVVEKPGNSGDIDSEKVFHLSEKYPSLPSEVGLVVYNILASQKRGMDRLGGVESFEKKSEIVKNILITNDFRDEFFFRHSLKVPLFESIDWEVVLKTHEKGVEDIVGMPYALLMLTFHNTNAEQSNVHQTETVAVNKYLIDKLLAALTKVRASLEESDKIRDILRNTKSITE